MLIRIQPLDEAPIFEQITFQVKGAVARGEVKPGDRLPSVRELAKDLSINPNTVTRAYESLERDGVIAKRQGAGCFITGRKSPLHDEERRRQLDSRLAHLVTDAFHLGFGAGEIREALDQALKQVRFPRGRRQTR